MSVIVTTDRTRSWLVLSVSVIVTTDRTRSWLALSVSVIVTTDRTRSWLVLSVSCPALGTQEAHKLGLTGYTDVESIFHLCDGEEARCSSVIRTFADGVIRRRIDP